MKYRVKIEIEFEIVSLVESHMERLQKHFEQGLIKSASTKLHIKVILKKQPPGKQPGIT